MIYSAVVLSAGKGLRYKDSKQDVIFHNKPLWKYSYDAVAEVVPKENIVVVGKDVEGGETRAGSVYNGLKALPANTDRVIVLEAARPMVTVDQVKVLIYDTHPSCTLVRPLVNSCMYRDGRYIDRNELYDMLCPQAFDYKLLLEAYATGNYFDVTEDTRAMYECHGIKPKFIETDSNLYKVTYPGDLDIIESIYKRLVEEGKITP